MVVLDRVCGEANRTLFIGFTDLFQKIADAFIPDFWPFLTMQEIFDNIFDDLQEQMKPFAYAQGAEMGAEIERKVEAWIRSKFDFAMSELEKARDQALGEIAKAERELREHADKIANLVVRVSALEGTKESTDILQKAVI